MSLYFKINFFQQWATFARNWWIVDAKFQSPFYLSNRIKLYLEGKHKPIYHPLSKSEFLHRSLLGFMLKFQA